MYLERLDLHDFRSYREVTVAFRQGANVVVGANAQGKTNLLEAVHYLALGASHRVATDAPLIRDGAEAALIRALARIETDHPPGRELTVEFELRAAGRNRARVNGQPQSKTREAMGLVRSVLFAPEDLRLVRGDPSDRRGLLDDLLAQRRPAYRLARQEYERVLRQRNTLLRDLRARPHQDPSMLEVWSDALVSAGATLLAARIAVVHALAGPVEAAYRDLVAQSPPREASGAVALVYELSTGRRVPGVPGSGVPEPADLAAELREGLEARARDERERGLTLVGPHRDELFVGLNGLPAKGYASHGELWSLALALRLASRDVLADVSEEPIVLLDDVFAELDEHRRSRLAARCDGFEQVIVSAAVDDDVPLAGPRCVVEQGSVHPVGERP